MARLACLLMCGIIRERKIRIVGRAAKLSSGDDKWSWACIIRGLAVFGWRMMCW
jgi:hypothetical protein